MAVRIIFIIGCISITTTAKVKPIGFWPLNEKFLGKDLSTHQNNADLLNRSFAEGPIPGGLKAFAFNEQSYSFIRIKKSAVLHLSNSFTILMYIYSTNKIGPLLEYNPPDQKGMNIWIYDTPQKFFFGGGCTVANFFPTAHQWNFVGYSFDAPSKKAFVWKDGVLVHSCTANPLSLRTDADINLGFRSYVKQYYWDGRMACLMMYGESLSELAVKEAKTECLMSMTELCGSNPCQNNANCTKTSGTAFICSCVQGYTGIYCETDIDECANSPCKNGGNCSDLLDQYSCACYAGYTGLNCETDIDECASDPCVNGGTCKDQPNAYICTCAGGYNGTLCENNINECYSNPCIYGATCIDGINGYTCNCTAGYSGIHCETDIDECASTPCLNNGTCKDHVNGFNCTCLYGYSGKTCETDLTKINECDSNPCLHGGNCIDIFNGYICNCSAGYNGTNCEQDIDECGSNPCLNNARCSDEVDAFTCSCPGGFSGIFCETDVDECLSDPCHNNGTCTDQINGYKCTCRNGITGVNCESRDGSSVRLVGGVTSNVGRLEFLTGDLVWGTVCDKNPSTKKWPELVCKDLKFPSYRSVTNAPTKGVAAGTGLVALQNPKCNSPSSANISECLTETGDCTHVHDVIIECGPRWCPEIKIPNSYTFLNSHERVANTFVTLSCQLGYQFEDGTNARSILCQESGKWSTGVPVCKGASCPLLSKIANADAQHLEAKSVGSTVVFKCQGKKRMRDGASEKAVTCTENGQWTDTVSDCKDNRCPPLPYVNNAAPNTTDADVGTVVAITCFSGHVLPGDESEQVAVCNPSLQWSDHLVSCHPIQCPSIPKLNNTEKYSLSRVYGAKTTIRCLEGHVFSDNSTVTDIECLPNRSWTSVPQSCQIIKCSQPPQVPHSVKTGDGHVYGTVIEYVCDSGHRFPDGRSSRIIQCTDKFDWNSTNFDCKLNRCDPVQLVDNAIPSTTLTDLGTVVTYACIPGYSFKDGTPTQQTECKETGWNGQIGSCLVLSCATLPQILHANYQIINGSGNQFATSVNVSCEPGYIYANSTWVVTSCSAIGNKVEWKPSPTDCNPLQCEDPPDIENTTTSAKNIMFNSRIIYSCPEGSELLKNYRNVTIRCNEDGVWDPNITACTVLSCPTIPFWGNEVYNTSDNKYLTAVEYVCKDGYKFKDKMKSKIAVCTSGYIWIPGLEDCIESVGISDDIKKNKTEGEGASSIGTVASAVVFVILALIFALDLITLKQHLEYAAANLKSSYRLLTEYTRRKTHPVVEEEDDENKEIKTEIESTSKESLPGIKRNSLELLVEAPIATPQKILPYYMKSSGAQLSSHLSRVRKKPHVIKVEAADSNNSRRLNSPYYDIYDKKAKRHSRDNLNPKNNNI